MNPQTPDSGAAPDKKSVTTGSHVTTTPTQIEGENYDPRLRVQMANEPTVVHTTRAIEPEVGPISDELLQKHEASKRMYPDLNLSNGETVLLKVNRHIFGILAPILVTTLVMSLVVATWIMYPVILDQNPASNLPTTATVGVVCVCLLLLSGLLGYIAVWVYMRNTFFLTNESVIQEIQYSLFAKHEQTVSLGSVEDVSFVQTGVLATMFNYGTIRLSTEGEETTYRFHYVASPREQAAVINNAVEAFKNGRPVDID